MLNPFTNGFITVSVRLYVGDRYAFQIQQFESEGMRNSQIITILESDADTPTVGNWMFNYCNEKSGPKYRQDFVESLDYRYKTIPDPQDEEKIIHLFSVECEHGWKDHKRVVDLVLQMATVPDVLIAIGLEHSINSIRNQCELCRLK